MVREKENFEHWNSKTRLGNGHSSKESERKRKTKEITTTMRTNTCSADMRQGKGMKRNKGTPNSFPLSSTPAEDARYLPNEELEEVGGKSAEYVSSVSGTEGDILVSGRCFCLCH